MKRVAPLIAIGFGYGGLAFTPEKAVSSALNQVLLSLICRFELIETTDDRTAFLNSVRPTNPFSRN